MERGRGGGVVVVVEGVRREGGQSASEVRGKEGGLELDGNMFQ